MYDLALFIHTISTATNLTGLFGKILRWFVYIYIEETQVFLFSNPKGRQIEDVWEYDAETVTGGWSKLQYEELHYLYSSWNQGWCGQSMSYAWRRWETCTKLV